MNLTHIKYFFWIFPLILTFLSCKSNPKHLQRIEGKQILIDNKLEEKTEVNEFIAPYKEKIDAEMNKILAYAPTDYYKSSNQSETNIGNFMADLCAIRGNKIFKKRTGKTIDFVLLNFGGIRARISKGNVTIRDAYKVMPFENSMVVVALDYSKIQKLLTYLAQSDRPHPISKQLRVKFKNNKLESATLNGKVLDKNRIYYVLTSDYLQQGGDRMNFFKKPIELFTLDYKIRAAIIDELTEIDTLKAKEDGRMLRY